MRNSRIILVPSALRDTRDPEQRDLFRCGTPNNLDALCMQQLLTFGTEPVAMRTGSDTPPMVGKSDGLFCDGNLWDFPGQSSGGPFKSLAVPESANDKFERPQTTATCKIKPGANWAQFKERMREESTQSRLVPSGAPLYQSFHGVDPFEITFTVSISHLAMPCLNKASLSSVY